MSQSPSTPPNPPSLSEQLADAIVKLTFGGGSISTIVFLFNNDIPKAVVAGAIATGAGLLAGFGDSILKPIKEWLNQKGDRVGKAAAKQADRLLENVSGFYQQYLEQINLTCRFVEVEGHQNLGDLDLDDVYVPLQLESSSERRSGVRQNHQIWDFLPKRYHTQNYPYDRLAIVAGPGYGKTTLLRHLTSMYATKGYAKFNALPLIPVPLRLREIYELIPAEQPVSLPKLIVNHFSTKGSFRHLELSTDWFERHLQAGKCLVMLDGLDEVPKNQRQKIRQWVNREMDAYSRNCFVLTSRPSAFEIAADEPDVPIERLHRLKILDFTPDDKRKFIDQWYLAVFKRRWRVDQIESQQRSETAQVKAMAIAAQIEQEAKEHADDLARQLFARAELNDLSRNPLLITMIAATHRKETELPRLRIELYNSILNLLLGTRPAVKKTQLSLTASENRAILQVLAWQLVQQERSQFRPDEAIRWIENRLINCRTERLLPPQKFLEEICDIAGLLVEKEVEVYEFSHQTFQEYLAALQVKELGLESMLLTKIDNDRWREVICFYAALGNATPLLRKALDLETIPSYQLADRLFKEARELDLDATLSQKLTAAQQTLSSVADAGAAVRLELRLRNLTPLSETTSISDPITWGEYRLFLAAQAEGQFHSKASLLSSTSIDDTQPVTEISPEDARWFCAWLCSQPQLQPKPGVYDFRLPTSVELSQASGAPGVSLSASLMNRAGEAPSALLRVVRVQLPDRYSTLLNYLANGRWREADGETYEVMKQVGDRTQKGYLDLDDLKNFPCEDLKILDQLWIKFSEGRFGFSVQKQIWIEVGGKLDFGEDFDAAWEAYEKMSDRVGWRKEGEWVDYSDLVFSTDAPFAQLPWLGLFGGLGGVEMVGVSLLSHPDL